MQMLDSRGAGQPGGGGQMDQQQQYGGPQASAPQAQQPQSQQPVAAAAGADDWDDDIPF